MGHKEGQLWRRGMWGRIVFLGGRGFENDAKNGEIVGDNAMLGLQYWDVWGRVDWKKHFF